MALEGKTAVVTGAAQGIGRSISEILLKNGAKVKFYLPSEFICECDILHVGQVNSRRLLTKKSDKRRLLIYYLRLHCWMLLKLLGTPWRSPWMGNMDRSAHCSSPVTCNHSSSLKVRLNLHIFRLCVWFKVKHQRSWLDTLIVFCLVLNSCPTESCRDIWSSRYSLQQRGHRQWKWLGEGSLH